MNNDELAKLRLRVRERCDSVGDDCWVWLGAFDLKAPKTHLIRRYGGLPQPVTRYPRPIMIHKGRKKQPYRHFFGPNDKPQRRCPTPQCQNPDHYRPDLPSLLLALPYDLHQCTAEDLHYEFPDFSLADLEAALDRCKGTAQ